MVNRDLYQILGVSRSASNKEISKAYKVLAKKYHPDKNQGNREAEEKFKEVSYAREILLNKEKRKLYDEFGEIGLREGFNPNSYRQYQRGYSQGSGSWRNHPFEDLFVDQNYRRSNVDWSNGFQDIFSNSVFNSFINSARSNRREGPGRDIQTEISIGFIEALKGTEKEMVIERKHDPKSSRTVRIRVPAGVRHEENIRLKGQGEEGGDLIIKVYVDKHTTFWREGDDLHMNLPLTIGEALKGARISIPTPDGEVILNVPKRTDSGKKLRLKGRGSITRKGNKKGDLIAHVWIVLPEEESKEIDKAVAEIEKGYKESPRLKRKK